MFSNNFANNFICILIFFFYEASKQWHETYKTVRGVDVTDKCGKDRKNKKLLQINEWKKSTET